MQKIIFVFNKFFTSLIKDVKKLEPIKDRVKKNYKAIDKLSDSYISAFSSEVVLQDVTYNEIIEAIAAEEDKEVFRNYVHILSVLQMTYKENDEVLANTVLEVISKIQKGENTTDDIDAILNDDIAGLLKKVKRVGGEAAAVAGGLGGLFESGSKICDLAKEISNDIDVSNLKLESPEDITKLLDFSGSNNVMGDIFKKVSSKIHDKIASGELKQDELFGEAMSMMGKMGGASSLFGNNPMMSEMMKMAKKGHAQPNANAFKGASSRDRLRKKLEERRAAAK